MILSEEEATNVVYEELIDWETVSEEDIVEQTRWAVLVCNIFLYKPTGCFYKFYWRKPATEQQENEPFCGNYEPELVRMKKITSYQWVKVEVKT